MAFEIGTASGHIDLLDKLRLFLTTQLGSQNWQTLRWREMPDAPGEHELVVKGPGLEGNDEVFVGIRTFSSEGGDYYNWRLRGLLGFNSDFVFSGLPGVTNAWAPCMLLANFNIKYWFVANGRRFVVVAKVSTVYESCYMGFIHPYLAPSRFPYPYFCAGTDVRETERWSIQDELHSHGILHPTHRTSDVNTGNQSSARLYEGAWWTIQNRRGTHLSNWSPITWTEERNMFPQCRYSRYFYELLRNNVDNSYTLVPLILFMKSPEGRVWGELDGCYHVSGFNNPVENIITINGSDHLVVQNVNRNGIFDFWALKLD